MEGKETCSNAPKFTKEQLVNSKHFKVTEKDILKALLTDDEQYSINEAKKMIEVFYKRRVK